MIVKNIHNHILFSKGKYIFMTTGFFPSVFFNNFKKITVDFYNSS